VPVAGRVRQAPPQPVDADFFVAGAAVQFGQRHGIRGDGRWVESSSRVGGRTTGSSVSHVTLARQNVIYRNIVRSVPFD
jgi:hypothetical protein